MEPTRLTDAEAILPVAALAARAAVARAHPAEGRALRRAFRRDTTLFGYLSASPIDHLGVPHRSYAQRTHLPGRVAIVASERDVPAADALAAFLERGGTVIAVGEALAPVGSILGLPAASKSKAEAQLGARAATGPLIERLFAPGFASLFWIDSRTRTLRRDSSPGATVLAAAAKEAFAAEWPVHGARLVHVAAVAPTDGRSAEDDTWITPPELARSLDVAADGPLADASVCVPEVLARAYVTSLAVFCRILAGALGS